MSALSHATPPTHYLPLYLRCRYLNLYSCSLRKIESLAQAKQLKVGKTTVVWNISEIPLADYAVYPICYATHKHCTCTPMRPCAYVPMHPCAHASHAQVLVLSFNEITRIEGLSELQRLQRLDLAHNMVRKVGLKT